MKTIYHGGKVFTGTLPLQQAFAVENGRILSVGTDAELLANRHPKDQVFPLEGHFVCPGFNDSHMHMVHYGYTMEQCDLSVATDSLKALQDALRTFLKDRAVKPGEWLVGRGWNQDYFSPARGIPTRQDLDEVTTDHPVCIIRCCGHCLSVNSKALELLAIDENTAVPKGGAIEKDGAGKLTGVFMETAMELVQSKIPSPTHADIVRMIRNACAALNRVGITSCHSDDLCTFDHVSWKEILDAFQEVKESGDLTVRVNEQSQFHNIEELRAFLDSGLTTGSGDALFRVGPLKMVGDGSLGACTAYLSGHYGDDSTKKGLALYTQEQFNEMISLANSHGMSAAIHSIGDGILDMILNAYEYAFQQHPRENHRSGIIHVQLTRPDQLERMQEMNLHAYVQTIFLDYDSHIVHERAGEALASTSYAFKTLRDMGLHVSNGTDCPVEHPEPMRGVQCAVTRQPLDGSLPPYRLEEAFTVEEALQSYTMESAYASFEEKFKGKIAPEMVADFVILSDNPFELPAKEISCIKTLYTFLEGQCVFQSKEKDKRSDFCD